MARVMSRGLAEELIRRLSSLQSRWLTSCALRERHQLPSRTPASDAAEPAATSLTTTPPPLPGASLSPSPSRPSPKLTSSNLGASRAISTRGGGGGIGSGGGSGGGGGIGGLIPIELSALSTALVALLATGRLA